MMILRLPDAACPQAGMHRRAQTIARNLDLRLIFIDHAASTALYLVGHSAAKLEMAQLPCEFSATRILVWRIPLPAFTALKPSHAPSVLVPVHVQLRRSTDADDCNRVPRVLLRSGSRAWGISDPARGHSRCRRKTGRAGLGRVAEERRHQQLHCRDRREGRVLV